MSTALSYRPGALVRARGREWIVLPETRPGMLRLRPLGGSDEDATLICMALERSPIEPASFALPDPNQLGPQQAGLILRDALRMKLRAGAGPFRSFGNLAVEPRAYQLVPLLMALKQSVIRLLIADDVGIGKTVEAALIARELLDRGEVERLTVICPPHLCDQWRDELATKFFINAEVVRSGTAARLERDLRADQSIFEVHPYTIVSLDYIKSDRRRDEFVRSCPELVIVDEAHTCVQAGGGTRHLRYELLRRLAEDASRHMLFLTATPHSGDDQAFHNLLGLLNQDFQRLIDLPRGRERDALRERLANHFVQRRRGDIAEWQSGSGFPTRESAEVTYHLTGEWGKLFDAVLSYARGLVESTQNKSHLQQRMSWWAALALLRCVSSSPAAASLALRTRLKSSEGQSEQEQASDLEEQAGSTVLDGSGDSLLSMDESVPAGVLPTEAEKASLVRMIKQADALRGPKNDPKLEVVIRQVRQLLSEGFRPVIFCRYIATAQYVAEELSKALKRDTCHVLAVTGELPPEEREARIDSLSSLPEGVVPVLVATDCLSEGINLQAYFSAVVHYDLVWNPTRHEQREGRVDRFGQQAPVVRALMLYGADNPVDGAVLRVILRKAEKIRKELGVSVPMPNDNNQVIEAVMKAVLLQQRSITGGVQQLQFDLADVESDVDAAWQQAKSRLASNTVFSQRRLDPAQVVPEWRKAVEALASEADVEFFVKTVTARLGAPLEPRGTTFRLPLGHLPTSVKERLQAAGVTDMTRIAFHADRAGGATYIHRAHPLVAILADYVAEQALSEQDGQAAVAARSGAIFSKAVSKKTTVYLLRLRTQITMQRRASKNRPGFQRALLAEECIAVATVGSGAPELLSSAAVFELMASEPGRNMERGQQIRLVQGAIDAVPALEEAFSAIAQERAEALEEDHQRVRQASQEIGVTTTVAKNPAVDVIGVYVLMPMAQM